MIEIHVQRDDLLLHVAPMVKICDRKTTLPVLTTIMFKLTEQTLELMATDLHIGARERFSVESMGEDGSFLVPGRRLHEILKTLPSDMVIITKDPKKHIVSVSCRGAKFSLQGEYLDAEDFPVMGFDDNANMAQIPVDIWKQVMDRVLHCASEDESRFNLNGVRVEVDADSLRFVSTDGHRLGLCNVVCPGLVSGKYTVPKSALVGLSAFLPLTGEIGLSFSEKTMSVGLGDRDYYGRLVDGDFPDYTKVVPSGESVKFTVIGSELISALKRVRVLTEDRNRGCTVTLKGESLAVQVTHPDLGVALDEVKVSSREGEGEDFELIMNVNYAIDAIAAVGTETVYVVYNGDEKPVLFRPQGDDTHFNLVMPMYK